jgi:beta-phosphoglucomutase
MTLEAVVFDFDGVIANSEPLHLRVYQIMLASEGLGFSAEEYYARYLGFDDVGVFEALARDKGLRIEGRMDALIAHKTEIYQDLVRHAPLLFDGAEACLRATAAAVPIAIASGALRHEIDLVLDASELGPLVPVIVAAGDTARGKPAPDPYLRAVELLSAHAGRPLAPARVVAIEDSRWGLESARAAGLRTIGVTTSYRAEGLHPADLILPDIGHITLERLEHLVAGRLETATDR